MRGHIIGASSARLMAPNPPPSVYDTADNWAATVYMLTSEGTTEGAVIPAQCADTLLETNHNGSFGLRLRAAKKLPWANFGIKNEGGTGSRIQFADAAGALLLGAGAFTLEGWVARDSGARDGQLFRRGGSPNFSYAFGVEDATTSRLYFQWSTDGSTINTLYSTGGITDNLLHFVSVDRTAGGVLRIYLDGVMVAKQTVTGTFFATTATVWMLANSSGHGSGMVFDDLRATIGVARYGSDSGHEIPGDRMRKGPTGDPYFDFVACYMRFNSDGVSQSFLDNSKYGFDTNNTGNFMEANTGLYGQGVRMTFFLLDAASWLNTATRKSIMNLRGKDFTIECDFKGETSATGGICGSWETGTNNRQWRLRVSAGRVIFETSADGIATSATFDSGAGYPGTIPADHLLTDNAFNYIVVERLGTALKIYLRGVLVVSGTLTDSQMFNSGTTPQFIPFGVNPGAPIHGVLDELRITVGAARYAEEALTPTIPTAQFPAYKGSFDAPSDVLLDERGLPLRLEDGSFLTEG